LIEKKILLSFGKRKKQRKHPARFKMLVLFESVRTGYFWFAMNKFTISEALTRLEDGAWHNVAYISADVNKKTGGKIVRIHECMLLPQDNLDTPEASLKLSSGKTSDIARRKQNHSKNATRNLRLRNGLVRKLHIYTLFSVDKTPVL
jgi:hypothetical protein